MTRAARARRRRAARGLLVRRARRRHDPPARRPSPRARLRGGLARVRHGGVARRVARARRTRSARDQAERGRGARDATRARSACACARRTSYSRTTCCSRATAAAATTTAAAAAPPPTSCARRPVARVRRLPRHVDQPDRGRARASTSRRAGRGRGGRGRGGRGRAACTASTRSSGCPRSGRRSRPLAACAAGTSRPASSRSRGACRPCGPTRLHAGLFNASLPPARRAAARRAAAFANVDCDLLSSARVVLRLLARRLARAARCCTSASSGSPTRRPAPPRPAARRRRPAAPRCRGRRRRSTRRSRCASCRGALIAAPRALPRTGKAHGREAALFRVWACNSTPRVARPGGGRHTAARVMFLHSAARSTRAPVPRSPRVNTASR